MAFIDPLVRGGETTILKANRGFNRIKSFYGSAGMLRARAVAREVGSGMRINGGFATEAALMAGAGGVAGGMYADDTRSGIAKGAALGVLGAGGRRFAGSMRRSYKSGLLGVESKALGERVANSWNGAVARAAERESKGIGMFS